MSSFLLRERNSFRQIGYACKFAVADWSKHACGAPKRLTKVGFFAAQRNNELGLLDNQVKEVRIEIGLLTPSR